MGRDSEYNHRSLYFRRFRCHLFFSFTASIEGDIVKSQVLRVVESLSSDLKSSQLDLQNIQTIVNGLQAPDLSEQDREVSCKNRNTEIQATVMISWIVMIGAAMLVLILLYLQLTGQHIDLGVLLWKNFFMLLAVVLTESGFLVFVTQTYVSVDINVIKKQVFASLLGWAGLQE